MTQELSLSMKVAAAVRQYLTKNGLTRRDFIFHLVAEGMSRRTCYNFWNGKNVTLDNLEPVFRACHIRVTIDGQSSTITIEPLSVYYDIHTEWMRKAKLRRLHSRPEI